MWQAVFLIFNNLNIATKLTKNLFIFYIIYKIL